MSHDEDGVFDEVEIKVEHDEDNFDQVVDPLRDVDEFLNGHNCHGRMDVSLKENGMAKSGQKYSDPGNDLCATLSPTMKNHQVIIRKRKRDDSPPPSAKRSKSRISTNSRPQTNSSQCSKTTWQPRHAGPCLTSKVDQDPKSEQTLGASSVPRSDRDITLRDDAGVADETPEIKVEYPVDFDLDYSADDPVLGDNDVSCKSVISGGASEEEMSTHDDDPDFCIDKEKKRRRGGPKTTRDTKQPIPRRYPETNDVCHICGKRFRHRFRLNEHLKRHDERNRFVCETCGQKFLERKSLTSHRISKHGGDPFVCDECEESFTTAKGLRNHKMAHRGEKPHKCDVGTLDLTGTSEVFLTCDFRSVTKSDLQRHTRTHTGERPFPCPHCETAFKQRKHLNAHVKRIHTPGCLIPNRFPCRNCEKDYTSNAELQAHVRQVHTWERPFTCDEKGCGKAFARKRSLALHGRNMH
ncbi:zinc finger protein 2 isoform X2 [Folsomia candida]|nr:zinc finger protein 2 isoform X2 [Folsomia candida]XP_035713084.1 zinc finger protein 2 isoform X2 [Folsomia candida]XP_035713085.1 zinc finger protein 2 isoform X2 [Folsomia candida]